MAKQSTVDLAKMWKDGDIRKEVKLRVVRAPVWLALTYGAEAWTLKAADFRAIRAAEMWIFRRVLRVKWYERRTLAFWRS